MIDAATFTAQTAAIPYAVRGVFYSEAYLLMQICEGAGVTTIIESGVGAGMSTRLLHAVWRGGIVSIERHAAALPEHFPHPVQIGRGEDLISGWIGAHPTARVGVLIDGPKHGAADALRAALGGRRQVAVIAQHDTEAGRGETAHSWDPVWRAEVGAALDARIDPTIRAYYPRGAPGLGVWRIAH